MASWAALIALLLISVWLLQSIALVLSYRLDQRVK